jgi:hypothetical protein
MNIKRAHDCLGHLSEDVTCKIAAQLGMKLSKTAFQTCEACAIGKREATYLMEEWVMTY